MARTSAEELIEQGKQIGQIAAKRDMLLRQMREKFGALSPMVEAQVLGMTDSSRLDELLLRILKAVSPEEMGL